MNCHICNSKLVKTSPYWKLEDRMHTVLKCISQECATIKVVHRCEIEVVLPDWDIYSYIFLIQSNSKWFRIFAEPEGHNGPSTRIYEMNVGHPGADGFENFIAKFDRFCNIEQNQDLKPQIIAIFEKFRKLIVFT